MQLPAWQRVRITAVMAIAYTAEHADTILLSSMYLAIGRALNISLAQLGTLSMWRALVQAIFIPFVGIAGSILNRNWLIAGGTMLWGSMSVGLGFAQNYAEAASWCAMNGIGLALVLPCVQSIIAEMYLPRSRGRAFGTIFTVSACGGMLCTFLAITYSNHVIGRYEGWRVVFFVIAGVAAGATLAVIFGGLEPRNLKPKVEAAAGVAKKSLLSILWAGVKLIISNTWAVFRVKTFLIITAAGIVGAVAIGGFSYKVIYFQLLGFSDLATATLSTCTTLGLALGFLMGGAAGDYLSVKFPSVARPFINQLSLLLAGPLTAVLYKAMPGSSRHATGAPGSLDHLLPEYGVLLFAIGTLASWPASNNAAIFAEVVPESIRTSVYAFDKCMIGAIGAITTPFAGLLAEKVFGFTHLTKAPQHAAQAPATAASRAAAAARRAADNRTNLANSRALENGLLCTILVPMAIKFVIYFGLYYTLPHDRIEELQEIPTAAAMNAAKSGAATDGDVGADMSKVASPSPPKAASVAMDIPMPRPRAAGGSGGSSLGGSAPALRGPTPPGAGGARSTLPSGPISREALRAGLAHEVVATAYGRSRSLREAGAAADGQQIGQALQPSRGGSWRTVSLESVNRYIALELTQQPPGGSPPLRPGPATAKGGAAWV